MPDVQQSPTLIDDFSGGNLYGVSMYKMPPEAVPHSVNMVFEEEIGAAMSRKGTAQVGDNIEASYAILGLTNFRSRATANHALLAVSEDGSFNDVYKLVTATWTKSLENDTKSLKTRFCQFLDSIVRVNGTDAAKSFDGTTWITTAGVFNLQSMPVGSYVINYKDRVHVLNTSGTLYSSSVPRWFLAYDGQTANFTVGERLVGTTSKAEAEIAAQTDSGATGTLELIGVSGTFANDEAITDSGITPGAAVVNGTGTWKLNWLNGYMTTPIDPDNGAKGQATGLGKVGGLLLIFFERAMYSWNGSATEADEIVGIGCSSQESIANDGNSGLLFFANKDGVYITRGGYPQKISRFVQKWFDNMSSANYEHIAGGCDGKHYLCSIGDVTFDGRTYENVVLRYSIQSQEWAVLSYPTQPRIFCTYINGTAIQLVYGDDVGNIIQFDSTDLKDNYSNTSKAIAYEIDTRDLWEPLKGAKKKVRDKMILVGEDSSGATVYYRTDSFLESDWKHLGEIRNNIETFPSLDIPPYRFLRFRIKGSSTVSRFKLLGIEIPNLSLYGY